MAACRLCLTVPSSHSLWQVAMDYFSECPLEGRWVWPCGGPRPSNLVFSLYRHYMAAFLERVPLTTDWKAEKVLAVCSKYELKDEGEPSVCHGSKLYSTLPAPLSPGCLSCAGYKGLPQWPTRKGPLLVPQGKGQLLLLSSVSWHQLVHLRFAP